ncbi:MAG: hypothetical protein ACOCVE_05140 [Desulfovermiculus sp.]
MHGINKRPQLCVSFGYSHRMLIAQGQIEDLPIVTSDPAFAHYSVELVW